MTRAAAAGMIDFSRFDPWDLWWWRKLDWILEELRRSQELELAAVRHTHWVTMASHGRLTADSFDIAKTRAGEAYDQLLKLYYPYLAETLDKDPTLSQREQLIEDYHSVYGRPGEERYEKMLRNLYNFFNEAKKKRSKQ